MSNKENIMNPKKQNSFSLKDHKSASGFKVPEGYFEALPGQVQARLLEERQAEPKKPSIRSLMLPQLAAAASFIGLMFISYLGIKFVLDTQDYKKGFQQTEIADLSDFPLEELDEDMLYELYYQTSAQESAATQEDQQVRSSENNNTDEMIEYLLLEDADIEILMQEL